MSTIQFRKGFSKFMIPIALLEKFGRETFISSVEVCNMIADSSKPNKLRNVYTIRKLLDDTKNLFLVMTEDVLKTSRTRKHECQHLRLNVCYATLYNWGILHSNEIKSFELL